ncbi:TlpA family protein disulfide reductase [Sulfuriferula sp. GW1]|uniref:TlpA family protein disulfide reductase n=1 Tax=Sulfuriferula sp. GW1 TaxID=3345111 RepID=UPI0039B030DD
MKKNLSLVLFALIGLLALGGGYYAYQHNRAQSAPVSAAVDSSDASATLFKAGFKDLAGIRQPLSQWRGKVLVVNFWATWCPPCRTEIPEFIKLQTKYGAQGLQFVGIAIDETAKVQAFSDQMGMNYPVLVGDLDAVALSQATGNRLGGLPYTLILDRTGKVVATELGGLSTAKLEAILKPLLATH